MDNRLRTLRSNVPTPRSYLPPPTARSAGRRSLRQVRYRLSGGEAGGVDRGPQIGHRDGRGVVVDLDVVADVLGPRAASRRAAPRARLGACARSRRSASRRPGGRRRSTAGGELVRAGVAGGRRDVRRDVVRVLPGQQLGGHRAAARRSRPARSAGAPSPRTRCGRSPRPPAAGTRRRDSGRSSPSSRRPPACGTRRTSPGTSSGRSTGRRRERARDPGPAAASRRQHGHRKHGGDGCQDTLHGREHYQSDSPSRRGYAPLQVTTSAACSRAELQRLRRAAARPPART